jgi:hypothetical protein
MHVFDGDPSDLEWNLERQGEKKQNTYIAVHQASSGKRNIVISGKEPPTDERLSQIMEEAKRLSTDDYKSIYLVLLRSEAGINRKTIAFVEFYKGELVAFCRPPWRKGRGL